MSSSSFLIRSTQNEYNSRDGWKLSAEEEEVPAPPSAAFFVCLLDRSMGGWLSIFSVSDWIGMCVYVYIYNIAIEFGNIIQEVMYTENLKP